MYLMIHLCIYIFDGPEAFKKLGITLASLLHPWFLLPGWPWG
jgi:hypothetical protein